MTQEPTTSARTFGSIRHKLLAWFLLLTLVPLIGLGATAFVSARSAVRRAVSGELEALRTVKANQLQAHFQERQVDLDALVHAVSMLRRSSFNNLAAVRTIKKSQIESYFAERRRDMAVLTETVRTFQQDAYSRLEALRTAKKRQVEAFFDRQMDNVARLATEQGVIEGLRAFEDALAGDSPSATEWRAAERIYGPRFAQNRAEHGYSQLFLVSADGQVLYVAQSQNDTSQAFALTGPALPQFPLHLTDAAPQNDPAIFETGVSPGQNLTEGHLKNSPLGQAFQAGLNSHTFQDFEISERPSAGPAAYITAPVRAEGQTVGVVIAQVSVGQINSILEERIGLGETGEVYLVGSDRLFRSNPRLGDESTVLNPRFRVDTEAADSALAGQMGQELILNYRGDRVLSTWAPVDIAGVRWSIIAEIGVEEALTPPLLDDDQDLFARYTDIHHSDNVYLIHRDGDLFFATQPETDYGTNMLAGPYKDSGLGRLVAEVLETQRFGMTDIGRYAPNQYQPALFMAEPVMHEDHVDFVVAVRLSPDGINSIMLERTGLGETGETYIVGLRGIDGSSSFRQLYFRSDSRFADESTILNPRYPINTEAANSALAGESGYRVILNYQRQRVLSSWTPLDIEGLQWAIIAEIGVEEAFTPRVEAGEPDFFTQYRDAYDYHDVFLISPDGGYVFYSVRHEPEYHTSLLTGPYRNTSLGRLVAEVLETKRFGMSDFERYPPSQFEPAAFIAQPLLNAQDEIDVIVTIQLAHVEINAIMQERTGLGETGETYLVGPDSLWRSDSRFLEALGVDSTVLNPSVAVDTPAVHKALAGKTGTRIINNYRGMRVLSSWMPVVLAEPSPSNPDGIRWAVIAEIEEAEVNRPVVQMAVTAGGLGLGTAAVVAVAILLVSRRLSAPIVEVARAATAVAGGDLTQRVQVDTGDEIEQLANAFNQMADEIGQMLGRLEQLATTDPLTELYNRRYFFELAQHELEHARRYGRPLSLLMLDLDEFKNYNDHYGHLAGDDLLRELGQLIAHTSREADTAVRYGGEEFLLLLPETDSGEARALAKRLWHVVRNHDFQIRGSEQTGRITASIGIANYPRHAQSVDGLVHAADMALLEAKKEKDRIFVAPA